MKKKISSIITLTLAIAMVSCGGNATNGGRDRKSVV